MNVSWNESGEVDPCSLPLSAKDTVWAKALLGVLYSCVFCASVCGNSLVIYVVATNRCMQSVTNLFITNLAVSDVVVSLSSLWLTPVYIYQGHWLWGMPACYLFSLLQGGSIFISTFTLTAIALDRYVVIIFPFRPRVKIYVCLISIISIWLASFLLVTPYVFHVSFVYVKDCDYYMCTEHWSVSEMRNLYGWVVIVLQYGIPFAIIFFCYARILYTVKVRSNVLHNSRSLIRQEAEMKRKTRLNKMLMLMVLIFALCWLPINVLNIVRDTSPKVYKQPFFPLLFLCAHLLGMSATCWNPILYSWMNENFRREFAAVLACLLSRGEVSRVSLNVPDDQNGVDEVKHLLQRQPAPTFVSEDEGNPRKASGASGNFVFQNKLNVPQASYTACASGVSAETDCEDTPKMEEQMV